MKRQCRLFLHGKIKARGALRKEARAMKVAVEVETTLAKNISALEGMEAYDAACKKLLVNREILAWIMQSCLEEYRDMNQNDFYAGYPLIKRALYYCSRMISSQYGKEFVHQEYEKIKKVYSIWLCAEPPQYRQNTITRYAVKEENLVGTVTEEKANYDLLTAIIICLGPEQEGQAEVLNLLEVLLSSEKKAEEKKKVLAEEYDITMTEILERRIEEMCNLSKGVAERGFQRGVERGIQRGMEQGMLLAIQSLMKNKNLTADEAMRDLGIEESKRSIYAEKLKMN